MQGADVKLLQIDLTLLGFKIPEAEAGFFAPRVVRPADLA